MVNIYVEFVAGPECHSQRVSQLVTELPGIEEMDLNPVIAFEDDVYVVDARIKI